MCYNHFLEKQALGLRLARPMCDGRPFASSPSRRLASRVFFFFAVFPFGGTCNLQSTCADAFPTTTKCLVVRKPLTRSAVVHTTPCLATSRPPFGSADVNPYRHKHSNPATSVCRASESPHSARRHVCLWGLCPSGGHWLHQEDVFNQFIHFDKKTQAGITLEALLLVRHNYVGDVMPFVLQKYVETI